MSQLLMPGPRSGSFGALPSPKSALVGGAHYRRIEPVREGALALGQIRIAEEHYPTVNASAANQVSALHSGVSDA
jgi:hypothetical protein